MEEETKKKTNKKILIITVITLIVVIGASIGGYFVFKYFGENKTTGTEWGDTYYAYLKSATDKNSNKEDYGLKNGMQNKQLQFIEVGETNPIMVMTYENEGKPYVNIYKTNGVNQVDRIMYQEPSTIEFLYDIQYNSYSWYIHIENETEDSYKKIYTVLENPEKNNEAEHTITKGDATTQTTLSGETITIPKFDELFVKPEVEPSTKIDFSEDIEQKELKENISTAVEGYKPQEEIVTEDVKKATENKVTELENTKQKIETAKAEIKADEERKAAEEAAKGLKVGNYHLKYGTYKSSLGEAICGGTYILNQDGTFTYKVTWENYQNEKYTDNASGKYSAYYSQDEGWIIKFSFSKYHSTYEPSNSYPHDFDAYKVTGDNRFEGVQYENLWTYQGN